MIQLAELFRLWGEPPNTPAQKQQNATALDMRNGWPSGGHALGLLWSTPNWSVILKCKQTIRTNPACLLSNSSPSHLKKSSLMLKPTLIASVISVVFLSQSVNAYDPDGFHRCMLENMREGMGNAAVLAVRQSCAHLHEATISGGRLPPSIADDSYIQEFKREHAAELRGDPSCQYPMTIDDCIVFSARNEWYPSRSLEEVREWLYRSQEEYGPMPPREN
ncbi:hypothetical protein R5M92_10275 [Halomonas sp. Bachu 37]|uniref:hypothetical protein n=1 Tax=Halomonas kashgarensis TaxID=3084920 RepID=UPI0032163616